MPDSNRPFLFTRPEEPPLGYEAIRAWLQKPRPLLSRALGWIPLLLSKLYDAGVFIKKNARPGAEWVHKAARKAGPVVRAGAKIGQGVRNVGTRMSAAAGAFRDPEGKNLGTERKVRRAGDTTQKYGEQITAGSEVAGAVLSVVEALAGVFKSPKPVTIDPRHEDEDPSEGADETPASDGRFLPRQPDKRPSAPVVSRTERVSPPDPPAAVPESGDQAEETPAELPHESAALGEAAETPSGPPRQLPVPGDAEEAPPDPPEPSAPAVAEEDPADTSGTETPEPDPEDPANPPADTERQPPPATPPAPPEDRFEGVPKVLRSRVDSLRERTPPDVLQALILDLCLAREWTTSRELAHWFSMHRPSLVRRHIGPLVDDEFLLLRFPDQVRSRKQAYRTNPEKWPPGAREARRRGRAP